MFYVGIFAQSFMVVGEVQVSKCVVVSRIKLPGRQILEGRSVEDSARYT